MKKEFIAKSWIALAIVLGLAVGPVQAANHYWTAKVTSILVDDSQYGGCMALLEPGPNAQGQINCGAPFASMSCDGTFNSKSDAANKLSALQLAMITDTVVGVRVDDARKVPGTEFCFVMRVDTSTTPNP